MTKKEYSRKFKENLIHELELFAQKKALSGGDTFDYRIECNSERLIKVPTFLNGFIVKYWHFEKQYEHVDVYGEKTYYDYLPCSSSPIKLQFVPDDNVVLKEFLILHIKISDK